MVILAFTAVEFLMLSASLPPSFPSPLPSSFLLFLLLSLSHIASLSLARALSKKEMKIKNLGASAWNFICEFPLAMRDIKDNGRRGQANTGTEETERQTDNRIMD